MEFPIRRNVRRLKWWFTLALIFSVFLVVTVVFCQAQTQMVIAPELTGQALLSYIIANYKTSTTLGYDNARDTLYKIIDLKPDNQLICVYSSFTITLDVSSDPSTDAYYKGINCEHSWPQSVGAADEPQRSDMHHLYPVKDNVNSSRNNEPYMEIPDANADVWFCNDVSQTSMPSSNLEEWAEKENDSPTGFEPLHASKGNVARSSFYFFAMYQAAADTNFWNLEKDVLYQWNYADPVDQNEYDRSYRIASYQNDKPNPFVLDSTLARRIWFMEGGGGSVPSPEPTVLTAGDIVIIGVNCDNPDDFAFVPLVDMNIGTIINFTDNGWKSTNEFYPNEGFKIYTTPSAVSAGTVIVYSSSSANFTSGGGSFSLSSSGDQIIAYQGAAASPTMLFAVNIEGPAIWQEDATSSNTSALPLGLTNGSNCVALTEIDNVKYDGSVTSGKAEVLATVSNKYNWIGNDITGYDFTIISDYSLPVELCKFRGIAGDRQVILSWTTESETENLGFNLYRSANSGDQFEVINERLINGHGSTSQKHEYSWIDRNVINDVTYYYKIEDVDYTGKVELHDIIITATPVGKEEKTIADGFHVQPCFPNPFNPETTLRFEIGKAAIVHVQVYDLLGNSMATLTNSTYQPGEYSLIWNGRDAQNRSSASGIYLIHTQSSTGFSHTDKVIFIR